MIHLLFGDNVIKYFIIIVVFCCSISTSISQTTVGLLKHSIESTDNGYVLFAPMNDTTTYLIDKCGYVVHKWPSKYRPGLSVYLLSNGKLLKAGVDKSSYFPIGGSGGFIQILDWNGNIEWSYKLSTQAECQHHDLKYLPNGNILTIVWEKKTSNESLLAGRDPAWIAKELWSEKIQELRPIGKDSVEIVWEWKLWDHLIQNIDSTKDNFGSVELHPELVDANFFVGAHQKLDWQHLNSIDYNPELDQILVSSRNFCEVWVIDHSTTTVEAAGHSGGKLGKGGDVIYRWGNPMSYGAGTIDDQKLFYQHGAAWIPKGLTYAGNMIVFNNCQGVLSESFSSVDIIQPPVDSAGFYNPVLPYGPVAPDWRYIAPNPTDFYASNLSNAQMLNNGNVMICNGANGILFEINPVKAVVWEYINPVTNNGVINQGDSPMMTNTLFDCKFYEYDFEGFIGKDLSQKGLIENVNELSELCSQSIGIIENGNDSKTTMYPNPANNVLNIETDWNDFIVEIYDTQGVKRISNENIRYINTSTLENGVYYVKIMNKQVISNKNDTFIIWR